MRMQNLRNSTQKTPMSLSEVKKALGFPSKGSVVNGLKVVNSDAKIEGNILTYRIEFPRNTSYRDVPKLLRTFYNTEMITVGGNDYVIRNHDYTKRLTKNALFVTGQMEIVELVLTNPGKNQMTALEDFDTTYSKMVMGKPDTWFRLYPYSTFNSPAFRSKLFSFVSNMGENYGYCDDKNIFYRRASLVMPKIKITKAPENVKMMYHTHPKKDEPSLSSADDYLIYFDMSHKPLSIRHFFTVMADRMDYFHIVPKNDKKNDYVRINEDKFIDELDAQIDVIGKKLDETSASENYNDDLHYCEKVTRGVVKWLNKKYDKYFTIKYQCYYKVRKNPGNETYEDLHLNDEYVAKPLNDIKSGKYSWPEFNDTDQIAEKYAYWHSHYFINNKDSKQLGYFQFFPGDERRFSHYMNTLFHKQNFAYWDILGILLISHDIRVNDGKVRDGKNTESRIEDILNYIGIEDKVVRDDIVMLDSILQGDVYTQEAKTLAGNHYFILPLADFSIKSINAIHDVTMGRREKDEAMYAITVTLATKMSKVMATAMGDLNKAIYRPEPDEEGERPPIPETRQFDAHKRVSKEQLGEMVPSPEVNLHRSVGINPPIEHVKADFKSKLPKHVFKNIDQFKLALGEKYDPSRLDPTKAFAGRPGKRFLGKYVLAVPYQDSGATLMIQSTTGNVEIIIPGKFTMSQSNSPSEIAIGAYTEVVRTLNEYGLNVPEDDIRISTSMVARNPTTSQVVSVVSPEKEVQDTASNMLREAMPGASFARVYTTKETTDKKPHHITVTDAQFNKLEEEGKLAVIQANKGVRWGYDKNDLRKGGVVVIDNYAESDEELLKESVPGKQTFGIVRKGAKKALKATVDKTFDWEGSVSGLKRVITAIFGNVSSLPNPNKKKEEPLAIFPGGDGFSHYMTAQTIPITSLQGFSESRGPTPEVRLVMDNPQKIPKSIRIEESPNKEKKLVAYFFDENDKRFRTVHFGARGMSDYTQHKDPERMKRYLARHRNMGEDWENPMTAGALSRWILWGEPSLRDSFNKFKAMFGLEGVMAVTNTRMNPPFTYDLMSTVKPVHIKRVNDRLFPEKMKRWETRSDEQKSNLIRRSKEFRKDLEHGYGWKGRTAKTAIEAMLSDFAKSFDKNGYAKVYRGLVTLPSENLTKVWEKYGVGASWSSYKEGADDYMGTPVVDTPGAVLVLVEGKVHTEEVAPTSHIIRLRAGFPLEKEIEVTGDIEVIRYSLWRIDPEDRIKKPKWETTGKNWKPWLRRGAKPISVVEVNRKFPADTPASESTPLPNPNRDYYAIIDGKPIYPTNERENPMAPGYQSYAWTTQDWRSIKVNNKGDIDYKEKCGAEGTQTPDGSPRLCLPADVIRTLMKTDSGKDILRTQARKKARAKKGERVSWHPRIKEIWARVEKKTVKDKPNPPSRVILLSGPSGSGKSTFARKIAEHFDTEVIPTYTTRPLRPNERDRVTVSEEKFLDMVEKGDFHEHKKLKNGFHYGRRKEDFDGVSVLEVSLAGMDYYKDKFPDAHSIYLQPDITGEKLRQRLIKRGGMSGEEATKRTQIASGHIKSAKNMDFDRYYVTSTGRFDELAEEIIADIPKENPSLDALQLLSKARNRLTGTFKPGNRDATVKEAEARRVYWRVYEKHKEALDRMKLSHDWLLSQNRIGDQRFNQDNAPHPLLGVEDWFGMSYLRPDDMAWLTGEDASYQVWRRGAVAKVLRDYHDARYLTSRLTKQVSKEYMRSEALRNFNNGIPMMGGTHPHSGERAYQSYEDLEYDIELMISQQLDDLFIMDLGLVPLADFPILAFAERSPYTVGGRKRHPKSDVRKTKSRPKPEKGSAMPPTDAISFPKDHEDLTNALEKGVNPFIPLAYVVNREDGTWWSRAVEFVNPETEQWEDTDKIRKNPKIPFLTKKITPKSRGWQDRHMNADGRESALERELDYLHADLHKTKNWLKIPKATRMQQGGLIKDVYTSGDNGDEHKELPDSFFAFASHSSDTRRRNDYGDREESTVSDELDMAYDIMNRHLPVVQNLVDATSNKRQRADLYKTALEHFDQLGIKPLDGMAKGVKFDRMPVWDETEIQRRIDVVSEDLDSSFGKLERTFLSGVESNPSGRHGKKVKGPFDDYFDPEEE
jgi:guanylate kinase